MKTQNCHLVPLKGDTFKSPSNPLKKSHYLKTPDHIFIPKSFNINKIDIKNTNLSDHKLICIKIKSNL